MKALINKSEITATTVESVIEQVVELLQSYGLDAAEECTFSYECKEGFGEDEYSDSVAQKFSILGEMNGDWQETITVTIFENHSNVTDEYFYTVTATQD